MFDNKRMSVIADSSTKVTHFSIVYNKLFEPSTQTNIDSSTITKDLAVVAANALLEELRDTRKATSKYLSSSQSEFCWGGNNT